MKKTNYHWWKQRLSLLESFYDLYRIDHIVGFFRLWVIPQGKAPHEGFFIPNDPATWMDHGKEILEKLIEFSSLLPIGEDLGTIPWEVFPILKNLGICGTRVIRWEVDGNKEYLPYQTYDPFTMTTVSTWDCDTLKMWWIKYPEEAEKFCRFKNWDFENTLSEERLFSILYDSHHTPSFFHINLIQEYLSLFPEFIWGGEMERINIPGTIDDKNWSYRIRPFLEDFISHSTFINTMQKLIQ